MVDNPTAVARRGWSAQFVRHGRGCSRRFVGVWVARWGGGLESSRALLQHRDILTQPAWILTEDGAWGAQIQDALLSASAESEHYGPLWASAIWGVEEIPAGAQGLVLIGLSPGCPELRLVTGLAKRQAGAVRGGPHDKWPVAPGTGAKLAGGKHSSGKGAAGPGGQGGSGLPLSTPIIAVLRGEHSAESASLAIEAGACDAMLESELLADPRRALSRSLAIHEALRAAIVRSETYRAAATRAEARAATLEQRVSKLESEAWADPLTGLGNRRHLQTQLRQMFASAVRYGTDLSCLMLDLDEFKAVNDTLGHPAGDEVLRMTGLVLNETLRVSDFAARYGGDEFVVLLPQSGSSEAMTLAARLGSAFTTAMSRMELGGHKLGVSIGVSCLSVSSPLDETTLIAHADRALYQSKRAGKGLVRLFGAAPPEESA